MMLVLSPSKGQDFSATAASQRGTQPRLVAESSVLIESLRHLDVQAIQELMTVSEKIARLNWQRFKDFNAPFDANNAKPAVLAFQGDVYQGLDAASFTTADLDFAQQHLRILSGLYGLLRPLDFIQAYRLEMKTRLANPRGANLYQFWGSRITDLINQDLHGQGEPALINLASSEYFKAVLPKALQARLIHIDFKEVKDGKPRIIGLFAKRARGLMAGWAIRQRIDQPERLQDFCIDGYRFIAAHSTAEHWVFERDAKA